jgi:hypothetical protein
VRLPVRTVHKGLLQMSHTRPLGTGWVTGQQGDPVEVAADPPGDGIGPDLTAPDNVPGMDRTEARRLVKDHRETIKGAESPYEHPDTELFETPREPSTANPFAARPTDPREGQTER